MPALFGTQKYIVQIIYLVEEHLNDLVVHLKNKLSQNRYLTSVGDHYITNLYTPDEKINVLMTQVAEKIDENLQMRYVKRHPMEKHRLLLKLKLLLRNDNTIG